MNVRFLCPACGGHHVLDMPETTIHMTCSASNATLRLRLGGGGDVKAEVLTNNRPPTEAKRAE